MFSGPASYLSGITFLFRKGHWSRVVLQLYDCYCKILLADVYSPMKGDWAIYIRPHFVRESILFTELNCARLGRTLSTYSRTFCISETLESRLILERQLSDVTTGIRISCFTGLNLWTQDYLLCSYIGGYSYTCIIVLSTISFTYLILCKPFVH